MPSRDIRAKEYDPLQTLRVEIRELQGRLSDVEGRIARMANWREKRKRYAKLRQFRLVAIRSLVALDRLTYAEIAAAFGISRQRVEQIAKARRAGISP